MQPTHSFMPLGDPPRFCSVQQWAKPWATATHCSDRGQTEALRADRPAFRPPGVPRKTLRGPECTQTGRKQPNAAELDRLMRRARAADPQSTLPSMTWNHAEHSLDRHAKQQIIIFKKARHCITQSSARAFPSCPKKAIFAE